MGKPSCLPKIDTKPVFFYNPFVLVGGLPLLHLHHRTRMRISSPILLNFLGASWNYAQSYLLGRFFPPYLKVKYIPVFFLNVKYNIFVHICHQHLSNFVVSNFFRGGIKYRYRWNPQLYPCPILLFFPRDNCYPALVLCLCILILLYQEFMYLLTIYSLFSVASSHINGIMLNILFCILLFCINIFEICQCWHMV